MWNFNKEKEITSYIQAVIITISISITDSAFGCTTSHIRKVTDYIDFSTSGKPGFLSHYSSSTHLGK